MAAVTLRTLLPNQAGEEAYWDKPVAGLTADSRKVRSGFLFFALPGSKLDGLSFVSQALANGAMAIVAGVEAPADLPAGVAFVRVKDSRLALALAAARFFGRQPKHVVAVTGTSGKTSVADFTRQIFAHNGLKAASLGTLGVVKSDGTSYGSLTTPDPIALQGMLADLAAEGIDHLALEASSHGLDQHRLDGVRLTAGAFTNLGRDHLDYHPTIGDYLQAKLRLFEGLLEPGQSAVINVDGAYSEQVVAACKARGLKLITVGTKGEAFRLVGQSRKGFAQELAIEADGRVHRVTLPLAGDFQAANALTAAGLAVAAGLTADQALSAFPVLKGAPGRLDYVGEFDGAVALVDYAHKPDALATVLDTLRPYATGRLVVVFGCGGDRDKGKRPIMGAIAHEKADRVIVTDDNPRSEEPAVIRRAVLDAAPGAIEIGDRAQAIRTAVDELQSGDVLVVAGKGHEAGQIVGDVTLPFSDHEMVRKAVEERLAKEAKGGKARMNLPLWTAADAARAMKARVTGVDATPITGASIDTRTIEPGDLFFAIQGENRDGHDFVKAALEKGASGAVVTSARLAEFEEFGTLYVVDDVLAALEDLGRASRERSKARIVAVTGSAGKTGTKEALKLVLSRQGRTHASAASYNNHWGVPLTLARMPAETEYAVFEIGMNHPGEILPLVAMVRPHAAIVTTVAPVHLAQFASVDAIADAKGEIFSGVLPGGVAIINADIPQAARLKAHAMAGPVGRVITFGEAESADVRLVHAQLRATGSTIEANVLGVPVIYNMPSPGKHLALNSLSVLAAVHALGADLALAALAMADVRPPAGRGEPIQLSTPRGDLTLIDESYNANPASMAAAIENLGRAVPGRQGRRIAIIGDMLELGPGGPDLHRAIAQVIEKNRIDLVFATGPLMRAMWDALSEERRGSYAETSADLEPAVLAQVRAGDVVMVKGSLGSRMGPIVKAFKSRYAAAPEAVPQSV